MQELVGTPLSVYCHMRCFCMISVPSIILVHGDSAATANNIVASDSLFRIGIVSDTVLVLGLIVVCRGLYVLQKSVC